MPILRGKKFKMVGNDFNCIFAVEKMKYLVNLDALSTLF